MANGEEFRIGLLGLGAIAQVVHLPILHSLPGVKLAGVCDVDRSKATAIASRFGVDKVYRSDDDVFADPDLDGIIICTPSYLHHGQASTLPELFTDTKWANHTNAGNANFSVMLAPAGKLDDGETARDAARRDRRARERQRREGGAKCGEKLHDHGMAPLA